jgi:hypothetical protein
MEAEHIPAAAAPVTRVTPALEWAWRQVLDWNDRPGTPWK